MSQYSCATPAAQRVCLLTGEDDEPALGKNFQVSYLQVENVRLPSTIVM
jgi:hypothetical protein